VPSVGEQSCEAPHSSASLLPQIRLWGLRSSSKSTVVSLSAYHCPRTGRGSGQQHKASPNQEGKRHSAPFSEGPGWPLHSLNFVELFYFEIWLWQKWGQERNVKHQSRISVSIIISWRCHFNNWNHKEETFGSDTKDKLDQTVWYSEMWNETMEHLNSFVSNFVSQGQEVINNIGNMSNSWYEDIHSGKGKKNKLTHTCTCEQMPTHTPTWVLEKVVYLSF
jgi:hypothetical protein